MAVGLNVAMTAGKSSLISRQKEIAVISNNVSKANDPNYRRQSAILAENAMTEGQGVMFGTGCHISSVVRAYNLALETNLRNATSDKNYEDLYSSKVSQVEDLLIPQGTNYLSLAVQDFADKLQMVATYPESTAERTGLISSANDMADKINQSYQVLADSRNAIASNDSTGTGEIKVALEELRSYLEQIPDLNKRIRTFEENSYIGQEANDLRDERDAIVSKISEFIDIRVSEGTDSRYTISLVDDTGNSHVLVDGTTDPQQDASYLTMEMTATAGSNFLTPQFNIINPNYIDSAGAHSVAVDLGSSGKIQGYVDSMSYITDQMTKLYEFASAFGDSATTYPQRADATAYNVGDYVVRDATVVPPELYRCTTAGTSGVGEPAWDSTYGNTTTDGTAVWTRVDFSVINKMHMQGYDLNGDSGGRIFTLTESNQTQPASGSILSVVITDPRKIAASSDATEKANGEGVLKIWDVMNNQSMDGTAPVPDLQGDTMLAHANRYLGDVAQDVATAKSQADTVSNIYSMFQNAVYEQSSVNNDEEMTNMLEVQRAYQASAKIINVVDQMMQTALSLS